jgi:hypothetical protein
LQLCTVTGCQSGAVALSPPSSSFQDTDEEVCGYAVSLGVNPMLRPCHLFRKAPSIPMRKRIVMQCCYMSILCRCQPTHTHLCFLCNGRATSTHYGSISVAGATVMHPRRNSVRDAHGESVQPCNVTGRQFSAVIRHHILFYALPLSGERGLHIMGSG